MGAASSLADPPSLLSRNYGGPDGFDSGLSPPRMGANGNLYSQQQPQASNHPRSATDFANPNDTSYYGLHDASSNPRLASQHLHYKQLSSRQQPQQPQHLNGNMALSPTTARTLALQAHEPGQSLPQGLAAGLSRLHLVAANSNPLISPDAASTGFVGSMSPPGGMSGFGAQYGSWLKSGGGTGTSPLATGLNMGTGSYGGGSGASGYGGVASPPRYAPLSAGLNTGSRSGAGNGNGYPSMMSQAMAPPNNNGGMNMSRQGGPPSSWMPNPASRPPAHDDHDDAIFDIEA